MAALAIFPFFAWENDEKIQKCVITTRCLVHWMLHWKIPTSAEFFLFRSIQLSKKGNKLSKITFFSCYIKHIAEKKREKKKWRHNTGNNNGRAILIVLFIVWCRINAKTMTYLEYIMMEIKHFDVCLELYSWSGGCYRYYLSNNEK